MTPFIFDTRLQRLCFGEGEFARLPDEVAATSARRVLARCTSPQTRHAQQVLSLLGSLAVATFDQAVMAMPVDALRQRLPLIAIRPPYVGGEMTPIYVLTEQGITGLETYLCDGLQGSRRLRFATKNYWFSTALDADVASHAELSSPSAPSAPSAASTGAG